MSNDTGMPQSSCPLEYGLDLFGSKWKTRIICVLDAYEQMRYSRIRTEMVDITDAVLAATLKELVTDGLVERIQFNEIPPHVEYRLTEKGKSVVPILQSICIWSGQIMKDDPGAHMKHCEKCSYRGI